MANPFVKAAKKASNPFAQSSNPFQMGQPQPPWEEPPAPSNKEEDEAVNKLLEKLSLKIEVKDKVNKSAQNMVFLEDNQKRQILKILQPFLSSELTSSSAEMVMMIKSRKNSVEMKAEKIITEVHQIPEESEPSEKESRPNNQVVVETFEQPVSNTQVVNAEFVMATPEVVMAPPAPTIIKKRDQVVSVTQTAPMVNSMNYTSGQRVETIQYSRPLIQKKTVVTEARPVPVEINEQTNYQYISQAKPEPKFEISPKYQDINSNPTFAKTKDFRLKSVIRSITTTKRPSFLRDREQALWEEEDFQMRVNKTQYPLANLESSQLKESGLWPESQRSGFFEGNGSYIKLQSNMCQESQLLAQPESNFTSNAGRNVVSNYMSVDNQRVGQNYDLLNQTTEFSKPLVETNQTDLINTQQVAHEVSRPQGEKVELNQLIQRNHLVSRTKSSEQSDPVISKNLQSIEKTLEPRPHTYSMNTTLNERTHIENVSQPVSRNVVLSNLQSKPVKRSFTNGLRIFRKVKDSQGNIVKEDMEQSINIYSNKILKTLNSKRNESVAGDSQAGPEYKTLTIPRLTSTRDETSRKYPTKLYTSSTITTPVHTKGLVSERNVAHFRTTNPRDANLYMSTRNIEENQKLSHPRAGQDNQLATSIFYSGTKTEQNSARNSNVKTHYVRSTRVSPAITIGNRSFNYYSKYGEKSNLQKE